MSSGEPAPGTPASGEAPRATPPIRWPKPSKAELLPAALWLVGIAIATIVPAQITPPTASDATVGSVLTAMGFTALGVAVMLTAAAWVYRRTRDSTALLVGAVPAFAVLVGGAILTATLLATSAD